MDSNNVVLSLSVFGISMYTIGSLAVAILIVIAAVVFAKRHLRRTEESDAVKSTTKAAEVMEALAAKAEKRQRKQG